MLLCRRLLLLWDWLLVSCWGGSEERGANVREVIDIYIRVVAGVPPLTY